MQCKQGNILFYHIHNSKGSLTLIFFPHYEIYFFRLDWNMGLGTNFQAWGKNKQNVQLDRVFKEVMCHDPNQWNMNFDA